MGGEKDSDDDGPEYANGVETNVEVVDHDAGTITEVIHPDEPIVVPEK